MPIMNIGIHKVKIIKGRLLRNLLEIMMHTHIIDTYYNVQSKIKLALTNLKNKYNWNFHTHMELCGSDCTPIILSCTVNDIKSPKYGNQRTNYSNINENIIDRVNI